MKANDFALISVSRFCEEFWSGNLCNVGSTEKYKSDRRKYTKCYIKPYFGSTLLNELRREQLSDFFKSLKSTETRFYTIAKKRNRLGSFRRNQFLSDGTIGVIRATLFAPLKYAYKAHIIEEDFAAQSNSAGSNSKFKGMSVPRDIFSQEELQRLENSRWDDGRAELMFLLARYTGMRSGELRGLLIGSVHRDFVCIEHGYNSVDGLKCTKTGVSRQFPIFDELYRRILEYINGLPESCSRADSAFLFPSFKKEGIPVGSDFANGSLARQMAKLGIPKEREQGGVVFFRTFHSLRHCMDTYLANNTNLTMSSISRLMGHSPQMVAHYADHLNEDLLALDRRQLAMSSLWPQSERATVSPEQRELLLPVYLALKNIFEP